MHATVLALHSSIGAAALLGFWLAALARKGGRLHRGAGRVYQWAMYGILLTAPALALAYFGRGQPRQGVFFLYLIVLVGTSVLIGTRAVRLKRDFAAFRGGIYPALAWAQLGSGALVSGVGLYGGQALLTVFGLVGVLRSAQMLQQRRAAAPPPGWWLREHFTAMIANGIATHVAFLGIGLPRILPADLAGQFTRLHLAWFAPLLCGLSAIVLLRIRQQRRSARRPRAVEPAAATA
jgi:hypothetical protein